MQPLGSLTASDFLAKVRKTRFKLELLDDSAVWHDLIHCDLFSPPKCIVKDFSANPSGAAVMPELAAGSFSAVVRDPQGLFNPLHPTSAYKDWFRVGRKIRISIGLEKSGVITYYPRFTGFVDSRSYDLKTRMVSISGSDAMKRLAEYKLGDDDRYWGAHEHFSSIATGGTGAELYDEGDACEIGAGELDNVTNWSVGAGAGGTIDSLAGESSTFALQFTRDVVGPTEQYRQNANIITMAVDKEYLIAFKGKIVAGTNYARLVAYETVGGVAVYMGEASINYNDGDEVSYTFKIRPTTASALQLRVSTGGKYAAAGDAVRIDNISVKTYDPATWMSYDLSATCNGVYAVTVAGEFVEQGEGGVLRDATGTAKTTAGGWHYDPATRQMHFSEQMQIVAGLDVVVYYFTTAALEDMVARLLWKAHIYASEVLAKAAMSYIVSGISLLRPWYKPGASALEAIRQICERANYRFWIGYDETPQFKPAPALKATPDFTLPAVRNASAGTVDEGREWIRNRIAIEGDDQAVAPGTTEKPTKFSGEVSDADSIAAYGETTLSWQNQLFQDQASIDDLVATLLETHREPKNALPLTIPFCAVPFESGDSLTFQVPITPGVLVEKKAIVRPISLTPRGTTLGLEIHEGYPVAPAPIPDIGSHENQKTAAPPPADPIPDIGSHENQTGA